MRWICTRCRGHCAGRSALRSFGRRARWHNSVAHRRTGGPTQFTMRCKRWPQCAVRRLDTRSRCGPSLRAARCARETGRSTGTRRRGRPARDTGRRYAEAGMGMAMRRACCAPRIAAALQAQTPQMFRFGVLARVCAHLPRANAPTSAGRRSAGLGTPARPRQRGQPQGHLSR